MSENLKPENKALVQRVLGYGTARTYNRHEIDRLIDAAREEGRAAQAGEPKPGPEGWVLVPREPTEAMTRAWWRSHFSDDPVPGGRSDRDAYTAMIAAASFSALVEG